MAGFAEWSNKKYAAAQQAQTQTQTQTQETAGGFAAWSNRKYAAQAQKPENLPQDAGNAFGMATAYPDAQNAQGIKNTGSDGGFAAWSNQKYAAKQAQAPKISTQDAGNAFGGAAAAYPNAENAQETKNKGLTAADTAAREKAEGAAGWHVTPGQAAEDVRGMTDSYIGLAANAVRNGDYAQVDEIRAAFLGELGTHAAAVRAPETLSGALSDPAADSAAEYADFLAALDEAYTRFANGVQSAPAASDAAAGLEKAAARLQNAKKPLLTKEQRDGIIAMDGLAEVYIGQRYGEAVQSGKSAAEAEQLANADYYAAKEDGRFDAFVDKHIEQNYGETPENAAVYAGMAEKYRRRAASAGARYAAASVKKQLDAYRAAGSGDLDAQIAEAEADKAEAAARLQAAGAKEEETKRALDPYTRFEAETRDRAREMAIEALGGQAGEKQIAEAEETFFQSMMSAAAEDGTLAKFTAEEAPDELRAAYADTKKAKSDAERAERELYYLRGARAFSTLTGEEADAFLRTVLTLHAAKDGDHRKKSVTGFSGETVSITDGDVRMAYDAEKAFREKLGNDEYNRMYQTFAQLYDEMQTASEQAGRAEWAYAHPVLSSLLAVPEGFLGGASGALDLLGQNAGNLFAEGEYKAPVNWNSQNQRAAVLSDTAVETVAGKIAGDGSAALKAGAFVYQTAVSAAESALAALLPGASGAAALGMGAGYSAARAAHERGADDSSAVWTGIFAGIFETLFESWSIGNLRAFREVDAESLADALRNVGKSMLVNASEETFTEMADKISDFLINGEHSEYMQAVRVYMEADPGMSEQDARREAALDMARDVGLAGAGGALMGFGFGTVGSAVSYIRNAGAGNAYSAALDRYRGEGMTEDDAEIRAAAEILSELAQRQAQTETEAGDIRIGEQNQNAPAEAEAEAVDVRIGEQNQNGVFDSNIGTAQNPATKEQFDAYVDYAYRYAEETNKKGNWNFPKQKAKIDLGIVSERAALDIAEYFGTDISGAHNVITDNDIRHIKNSHGEGTNEKYPVTAEDIKKIPDIIENFDDVLYVRRRDGKAGIFFVRRYNGVTYYLEQIQDESTLSGKQMIKAPTGTIPNVEGLRAAIQKKWSGTPLRMNQIPQMYAQDVWSSARTDTIASPGARVNRNFENSQNIHKETGKTGEKFSLLRYFERTDDADLLGYEAGQILAYKLRSLPEAQRAEAAEAFLTVYLRGYMSHSGGADFSADADSVLSETMQREAFAEGRRDAGRVGRFSVVGDDRTVSAEARETLERIARDLGAAVTYGGQSPDGEVRGYEAKNDRIHIYAGARVKMADGRTLYGEDAALMIVAMHEITHRLKRIAPEAYRSFEDFAVNAAGGGALVREYMARYGLDGDAARAEAAADYAMTHFCDEKSIGAATAAAPQRGKFAQMMHEILEWFKKKFGGGSKRFETELDTAIRLWNDAYNAAARNAQSEKNTAGRSEREADVRYSFAERKVPTYEELVQKPDMRIIDIRGDRQGRIREQRQNFLNSEAARKMVSTPVVNRDTGETVFVTPRSLTHTFSNLGAEQIGVAEHIPELIEEAVLTHAAQSRKAPDDHSTGVYTLFAAVRTEKGVVPVKVKVKEYNITGQDIPPIISDYLRETNTSAETFAQMYDARALVLEAVEKTEDASSSATTDAGKPAVNHPSASSAISIRDLLALVNGDAKKYVPVSQKNYKGEGENAGDSSDQDIRRSRAGSEDIAALLRRRGKEAAVFEKEERARGMAYSMDIERFALISDAYFQAETASSPSERNEARARENFNRALYGAAVSAAEAYHTRGKRKETLYAQAAQAFRDAARALVPAPNGEGGAAARAEKVDLLAAELMDAFLDSGFAPQNEARQRVSPERASDIAAGAGLLRRPRSEGGYAAAGRDQAAAMNSALNRGTAGAMFDMAFLAEARRKAGYEARLAAREQDLKDLRAYAQARVKSTEDRYAAYKQAFDKSRMRERILRNFNALYKWADKPDRRGHSIPEDVRAAVLDALRTVDVRRGTGMEDARFGEKLDALAGMLQAAEAGRAAYDMLMPPAALENVRQAAEKLKAATAAGKSFAQMSFADIDAIDTALNILKISLTRANEIRMGERSMTLDEAAERCGGRLTELRDRAAEKRARRAAGKLTARAMYGAENAKTALSHGLFDLADHVTFCEAVGGEFADMVRYLNDCFNDRYIPAARTLLAFISENVDARSIRQGQKQTRRATLGGTDAYLTDLQLMELYLLDKRKAARRHMYDDAEKGRAGIVIEGEAKNAQSLGASAAEHAVHRNVTREEVQAAVSMLSAEQKRMADAIGAFLSGPMADMGNETSMRMYGYRAFNEKNYIPIRVDGETLDTTGGEGAENLYHILNMSFTKHLADRADNALIVGDLFSDFFAHASDMMRYCAFAEGTADAMRLLNASNARGQKLGDLLDAVFPGAKGWYMSQLDALGASNRGRRGAAERILEGMIGGARGAAISYNMSVVVQQPTAVLRALAVLDAADYRALPKAAALGKFAPAERIYQYCPIAWWKSLGFFDLEIGRSLEGAAIGPDGFLNRAREAGMWAAGKADDLGWQTLWLLCETHVKRTQKTLEAGTDAFYTEVGRLMSRVVNETQVVDTPFNRTQLQRNKNTAVRAAVAFTSEPQKSLNVLIRCFYRLARGEKGAARALAKSAAGILLANAAAAALKNLVTAWRDGEEDETFDEKYRRRFLDTLMDQINPVEWIPILGEPVMNALESAVTGKKRFTGGAELGDTLFSYAEDFFASLAGGKSWQDVCYRGLKLFSTATGVGFANLWRDLVGGTLNLAAGVSPRGAYEKALAAGNAAKIRENYKKFLDAERKAAAVRIYGKEYARLSGAQKKNADGEAEAKIRTAVRNLFRDDYNAAWTAGDLDGVTRIRSALLATEVFTEDDVRDLFISFAQAYFREKYRQAKSAEEKESVINEAAKADIPLGASGSAHVYGATKKKTRREAAESDLT